MPIPVCDQATVAGFLGFMPTPGYEVVIPESRLAEYTKPQIWFGKACAKRFRIKYRIVKE